ncbi:AAA family ATPase [Roseovarius sp. D22-M7]|uniref:AAA family ATPase n=1 Tax=Roseovarius sp. D22-M7 TaxID=3127116 RepID=UPI00300F988B
MTVFIDGVAVQFYRGIGSEIQYIAPFARMNFFIGVNNSGKSIVLNLLATRVASTAKSQLMIQLTGSEVYRGEKTGQFLLALGSKTEDVAALIKEKISEKVGRPRDRLQGTLEEDVEKVCEGLSIEGIIWSIKNERTCELLNPGLDSETARTWLHNWQRLWSSLTNQQSGGYEAHWYPETLRYVANNSFPNVPDIHLIPAKREFGKSGEDFDDLSGKGLLNHLQSLQNPDFDKRDDESKFARINKFLQSVTDKPDARLEVPSNLAHLLIHMDNKVLPLAALGTGIHEVVLIAAFCTIHDGSIMCIEEPEIHLHPVLQRKLVLYLLENTKSQYFIATHSAAFIDTPNANVFHVENDGVQTRVKSALTKNSQRRVLDDLGYHASDLLQTNAVVWVEGPSDRIYLNHWIKAMDSRLVEGVHYSVLFYGGALIAHLSASDDAVTDFIKLRDLNRNMAILMDSDRANKDAELKPHVKRILDELRDSKSVAWVTQGREAENYLDGQELQSALKKSHPRIYDEPCRTGPYDHAFHFMRKMGGGRRETYKLGDKVAAANVLCQQPANLDILDLRDRLSELTAMICQANNLESN